MEYVSRKAEITLDSVADSVLKDMLDYGRTDLFVFSTDDLAFDSFSEYWNLNLVEKYADAFYIHSREKIQRIIASPIRRELVCGEDMPPNGYGLNLDMLVRPDGERALRSL